jgi:hypothetical protein
LPPKPSNPEGLRAALAELREHPDRPVKATAAKHGVSNTTLWRHLNAGAPDVQDTFASTPDMTLAPTELPVFFRDYSHLDKLHVFPLGDVHKGSANFQNAKWQEWLAYVADNDHCSMLGTGDFLNVALKDSVSDVYTETQTVGDAKWQLRDELQPLADNDQLDLLIPGNHEGRITRATGDCPIRDVAQALRVNYAPVSALVVYTVGDVQYEVAIRHGSGSGRAGAQATRMEREAQTVIADVYVTGHTHRQQVLRGAVFQRDGDAVARRRQLYVSSGSFLSYEEYAARAGLTPADIGCPRIRLDGTRKDAHASV